MPTCAMPTAQRRRQNGDEDENGDEAKAPNGENTQIALSEEEFEKLAETEEFILSVADDGFGKRTSAYEYRITGRGGQGVVNMDHRRT